MATVEVDRGIQHICAIRAPGAIERHKDHYTFFVYLRRSLVDFHKPTIIIR